MATQSQYSCLGKVVDRKAWWATVNGGAKSRTRLNKHLRSSPRITQRDDLMRIQEGETHLHAQERPGEGPAVLPTRI